MPKRFTNTDIARILRDVLIQGQVKIVGINLSGKVGQIKNFPIPLIDVA